LAWILESLYIWVALLGAAIFGLVTVLDKRMIDKHIPNLISLYLAVAGSLFFYGILTLWQADFQLGGTLTHQAAAFGSGLCWGGALALMFWGYKLEEASRASAIIHTFPVFVAVLAILFLGESLALFQWLAIVVVVAGTFLISLRNPGRGGLIRVNRAFPILIGASLCIALANLTSKYAIDDMSVWSVYGLRNFGMGLVFLSLGRPRHYRQLFQSLRRKENVAVLVASEYTLAPLATFITLLAIQLGPVSVVSTVMATRPLFVFCYSTLLSIPAIRLLEEPLERHTLAVKLASVILIVTGIGALSLL
jgi:drug/metabolite transporter (DMT)-like permease